MRPLNYTLVNSGTTLNDEYCERLTLAALFEDQANCLSMILPNEIVSNEAWYPGSSADADPVTSWIDQSGNSRNALQGTGANQPELDLTGGPNGTPIVIFDGVNDNRKTATFPLEQPEHVFIVLRVDTFIESRRIFDGISTSRGLMFQTIPELSYGMYAGIPDTGPISGGHTQGVWSLVEVLFDGANSTMVANGDPAETGEIGTNDMDGITLGSAGSNSLYSAVSIADFAVFSAVITGEELTGLRAYYNETYGL